MKETSLVKKSINNTAMTSFTSMVRETGVRRRQETGKKEKSRKAEKYQQIKCLRYVIVRALGFEHGMT